MEYQKGKCGDEKNKKKMILHRGKEKRYRIEESSVESNERKFKRRGSRINMEKSNI